MKFVLQSSKVIYLSRLFLHTKISNSLSSKILYLFDHLIHPKEVLLECQRHGECPAAFTPTCSLSGYIGTIEDDTLIGQEVESVTLINGVRHLKVKIRSAISYSISLHLFLEMSDAKQLKNVNIIWEYAFSPFFYTLIGPNLYNFLSIG